MQWTKRLTGISTGRNILVGLLVILVLGIIMMAIIQPQMMALSGGLSILDARLFYTTQDVNQLFAALGDAGRLLYTYHQIADSFFPAAYGITLALALVNSINRISPQASHLRLIVILPFLAALSDYAENSLIATQLASYPALSGGVIMVSAVMTLAKWVLIIVALGAAVVLGLVVIRRRK